MKFTNGKWTRAARGIGACLIGVALTSMACAQSIITTTVQGTAYLANGLPGSGTLQLSWPAFSTGANQAVVAGRTMVAIGANGVVSVSLAPNVGALPAGLYYTAVYHMSDGTTSTEYWVVPATGSASIAQVRAQVMPATQAVQAVSKAYVDQAIQSIAQGSLTSTGGTLTGPLYLNGDPAQALQAADKNYVDSTFAQAVPLTGAALSGPLTSVQLGAAYQVDQFPGADFGAKLQACLGKVSTPYGGTCDARNFTGSQSMSATLTISSANTTVMLPCATISTANQVIVSAGTRNVALRGCALRGASNASGNQGGTVFLYSGSSGAMIQVGDRTYAADTLGFHLDNAVINTTASISSTAQGLTAYRTQEMDLESLYFLGNSNQTGMTLDGTGNYTGGTYYDIALNGYQTAVSAIGHQTSNPATTDWLNASTFVRLHIDCPTNNGNSIGGTTGINLQQGDGNTFTGGDVEGCATALHLGANAQNNTIVGLRNENSSNQVVADLGSAYNNWITGGTMFTGKLTDNGTRNSFLDTFHRSFNSLNGDWYGIQQDATITNHYRVGIGTGNERGLLNRYQTDYGYRWTTGLSDATAGEQFYQVLDELNNVYRLSIGQYNNGQSSTNNQTVINAAGTGAVVLNGSNNSGTGGVVIGSGGPGETTVATINNAGNAQFNGSLQVGGASTFSGSTTVRNQADAEIDAFLWAGATGNQKESYIYKDYTGASQWYMVKDASNNWALNSATGGLDSFKAYQSANSGDTYINASNPSGVVRVNYETGAGTGFNIYGGNSSTLYASFTAPNAVKLPGLKAGSGTNCLQIDSSGYITNTGAACGTGSGSGVVNSGGAGQIAFYSANGTSLSGMNAVPVSAGGTGATTPAAALTVLGAPSLTTTAVQSFSGPLSSPAINASVNSQINVMAAPYNAKGDCVTDDHNAINAALQAAYAANPPLTVYFPTPPGACYLTSTLPWLGVSMTAPPAGSAAQSVQLRSKPSQDLFNMADANDVVRSNALQGFSISNLHFVVDDSVDVSASHPYRLPGRTTQDAVMTAGSAALASAFTNEAVFSPGDVGQAIVICGAGTSGTSHPVCGGTNNLVTTIASYQDPWHVTLALAASASVTNGTMYIAVGGMTATQTVGNCAFGLDSRDANQSNWKSAANYGFINGKFNNISITSLSGTPQHNSCAFFMQGALTPYNVVWDYVDLGGLVYGFQDALYNQNVTSYGEGGDYNSWHHGYWGANFPFIFFNGALGTVDEIQGNSLNGLMLLPAHTPVESTPSGWKISIPEDEGITGTAFRIGGRSHTVIDTMIGEGTGFWDASYSRCNGCLSTSTLTLSGNNNEIVLDDAADQVHLVDLGAGNRVTGGRSYNPLDGKQSTRYTVLNKSRVTPTGAKTAEFIMHGLTSASYNNDLDLWYWPQDMFAQGPTGTGVLTQDSASETGYNIAFANGSYLNGVYSFGMVSGGWTIGAGAIPATKVSIYIKLKCPSGAQNIGIGTNTTVGGGNPFFLTNYPCTTAYTIASGAWDLSALSGAQPSFAFSLSNGVVQVAWIAIRPWSGDELVNGSVYAQNLNGNLNGTFNGIALTGGGAAIPTGPGSATSGNLTTFSGTQGQIQDSGVALSSLAGIASPTFTGTISAPTINATANYQVNGTAIAAANLSNGTTGSGSIVLASGPTFKGNTTLANAAAAEQDLVIQPGSSADQIGAVQWNNYSGTAEWKLRKDASNYLRLTDSVNSQDRAVFYQNGQTILNSGVGSNAVVLNGLANSGTGGLLVQNGGSSPSTVFTVTGSGNTTATGFVAGKSMAGSGTMGLAAGGAAGTGPSIACAASHVCDSVSGVVTLTTGTGPSTGTLATLTFPSAHTNYANCVVNVASGTAQLTSVTWSESAAALTLTSNSALSASTAYQIRYWCGGY